MLSLKEAMKKLKTITHLSVLITTPSLLASPQNYVSQIVTQEVNWLGDWWWGTQEQAVEWQRPSTYDEIMQILDDLESGELEQRYSPEQLEKVNEYLATLAIEGILPNEFDEEAALEADIEDLMYGEDSVFHLTRFLESSNEYMLIPTVIDGNLGYSTLLCGKVSKSWKKTKKFVKKHKKEIIIGAVVVVAVTVVAVAVVAASSTITASAAGAAGVAASAGSNFPDSCPSDPDKLDAKGESLSTSPIPKEADLAMNTVGSPVMQGVINEHVTCFKEFLAEDKVVQQSTFPKGWDEMSLSEKAKEVGAGFAHQAYEEIVDLVKVVPQLCEEVEELGAKFLPDSLIPHENRALRSQTENYKNLVAKGHEVIDKAFSTDQAKLFTEEIKASDHANDFAIGLIAFPGIFSGGKLNVKKLANTGKTIDRSGFARAGRNLMKHGYRRGSVFPKPLGSPAQVNAHGQRVLESILNHPEKQLFPAEFGRYGKVVDIYAPGLGGARFSASGEFIGFLEP